MPPRRPQSKQKLPNKQAIQKKPLVVEDDAEAMDKFKVELQWCVQQLEAAMQKASIKEKEGMAKSHRTLTSGKAAQIKKRQVMSSLFGDYRAKMEEEEKKLKIEPPRIKKQSAAPSKSVFLRKSADRSSGTACVPTSNLQESEESQEVENTGSNEAINLFGKDKVDLSEGSTGESRKTAATSFKFPTQSGNTFRFNFSSAS